MCHIFILYTYWIRITQSMYNKTLEMIDFTLMLCCFGAVTICDLFLFLYIFLFEYIYDFLEQFIVLLLL